MYITYEGKQLAFKFMHVTDSTYEFQEHAIIETPRQTVCIVLEKKEEKWVDMLTDPTNPDSQPVGVARVHPNDKNFDKEKGRQISFGRAIASFVPKKDRLKFWEAYSTWKSAEPRMQLSPGKNKKVKEVVTQ